MRLIFFCRADVFRPTTWDILKGVIDQMLTDNRCSFLWPLPLRYTICLFEQWLKWREKKDEKKRSTSWFTFSAYSHILGLFHMLLFFLELVFSRIVISKLIKEKKKLADRQSYFIKFLVRNWSNCSRKYFKIQKVVSCSPKEMCAF